MTEVSFHRYVRFNDTLERELMQRALSNGESVSIMAVLKSSQAGLKKAASAIGRYIIALTEALNEARARDAKFCRSHW